MTLSSFSGLMQRRREERLAELASLLSRAAAEEKLWTKSPETRGGLHAQKVRARNVRAWEFELKELTNESH